MDITQFDRWIRKLSTTTSRRQTFLALFLGTFAARFAIEEASAGPSCKNVGKKCKKKDCCSGVCQGKKRRKKCKAHGAGGCQSGEQTGSCDGANVACTTSAGEDGLCQTTTGNAGYCSGSGLICTPCQKDADCRGFCGPDAACIRCVEACVTTSTACVGPVECS
jgi:hypothetical protein